MNDKHEAELQFLKRRQESLQMQLSKLTLDIEQLASQLEIPAPPVPEMAPVEVPIPENEPSVSEAMVADTTPFTTPPPLPPLIPIEPIVTPTTAITEETVDFQPPMTPPPPAPRETFEMKLGTYWLVRVGIVMLLTGLVFLGTYAYKNFIGKFEAPAKVALLYLASAALLGCGGWLQRKREKESLRNYGQVLFAGGLAAVYFTTYAAHYVSVLRVIASPVVDGLLLLAWAAATIWIADRRKSEVLALFAISLSYYTAAITDIGLFTLASNLLLTATAVFFLVRHQWTKLSFISIVATYGGFAFWRFYQGGWSWDARAEDVWTANLFLAGYWLSFTAAVFFARGKSLAHGNRALFASMNNAAFFGLVVMSMWQIGHGHFWKFSLSLGSALLVAAWAARKRLADEPVVKNTYLVQGLTLVTLGFIAYFAGLQLALVLAAESVVLIFLGHQQRNLLVRAGGFVTAALSTICALSKMTGSNADVLIGAVIATAFLLNAWWENRRDEQRAGAVVRPFSGYFVGLAMILSASVTWHAVPESWRAVAWMIEAMALTSLFYRVRISELPIFSQALAIAAQAYWFFQFAIEPTPLHWSLPAIFISSALALAFLGHHQKNLFVRGSGYLTATVSAAWAFFAMTDSNLSLALGGLISAALLLNGWWENRHDLNRDATLLRPGTGYFIALAVAVCGIVTWHAVPAPWRAGAWMIEAVALTLLFYAVRIRELPVLAQGLVFVAQSYWFFEFALRQQRPHWLVPATLVAGTLALSHWWQRQQRFALQVQLRNLVQIVYALALVGVLFFWFQPKFAPAAWLAFLCALAMGLTIYGVITRAWALAACAQIFLLISSVALCQQFLHAKPAWHYALAPIATWLVLGVATTAWLSRRDTRETVRTPLLQVSTFYRAVAFVMTLWWIFAYVPAQHYFWSLCGLGLGLAAIAGRLRNREALLAAGATLFVAFAVWFGKVFVDDAVVSWPNLLAVLATLALQQIVRRFSDRYELPAHTGQVLSVLAGLALWSFVTRWVVITSGGAHFYVTVSWAVLAALLFAAGFGLRERMHRWLGLGILTCAIARVFLSDVWRLEPIYRILSFLALGVVLLALGFVYNKFQEKIRQWL